MIEGHIIFNAIIYSIVIAYILYINFSAYYQTGTGFLKALVNLFQNWIFRTVYLLIVGFFALDLFPYGGFVLAILLTIAFLNTNMLVYKKDVEESFTMESIMSGKKDEKKALPSDGTVGGSNPFLPNTGTAQMATPPMGTAPMGTAPMGTAPMGTAPMATPQMATPQMGTAPMGTSPMGTAPMGTAPMGTAPMGTAPTFPAGTSKIASMPPPQQQQFQ